MEPARILRHQAGISGNVFAHMRGQQSGPNVVTVACLISDNNCNCFALEEWHLPMCRTGH